MASSAKVIIPAGERSVIPTGLVIGFPPGTYGKLTSRSSLALKGIDTVAGTIDPGRDIYFWSSLIIKKERRGRARFAKS